MLKCMQYGMMINQSILDYHMTNFIRSLDDSDGQIETLYFDPKTKPNEKVN